EKREVIAQVCDGCLEGKRDGQFLLIIWKTGSGTQSNMHVKEFLANRAHQPAGKTIGKDEAVTNAKDEGNKCIPSNDTFPTGMHIAAYKKVVQTTIPGVIKLRNTLHKKANAFKNVVKIGRTHLMDATPLTLGQEISGYVAQLDHGIKALENTLS